MKNRFQKLMNKITKIETTSSMKDYLANNSNFCKFVAFTLAEILITLAIIGVVAALTLPNLIQKLNEKATVVKVQKAYALLSQAYLMAVNQNGEVSGWGLTDRDEEDYEEGTKATNANIIRDNLKKQFKISNVCECHQGSKCSFANSYKFKNGSLDNFYENKCTISYFQTIDGASYAFVSNKQTDIYDDEHGYRNETRRGNGALKEVYGLIIVDINGETKGKNTYGEDVFYFNLTNSGIIPQGSADETYYATKFSKCSDSGLGCAAWVVKQKNMKYLHSDKCSWENTSCK